MGDRIQIGIHAGDVMDLTTSRFTLGEIGNWVHADQITGRIVAYPQRQSVRRARGHLQQLGLRTIHARF